MRKIYTYHKYNENFFEIIDSEEKAYWLGFIAADGCINIPHQRGNEFRKRYRISLVLSNKDIKHLEKFKSSINFSDSIKVYTNKNQNNYETCRIVIHSQKMFNDLIDKGLTPRKSLTLLPPKNVPYELIRHWIRGYFDGDGCVHITKSTGYIIIIILSTKEVLNYILTYSNLNSKINRQKGHKIYQIRKNGKKALTFLSYIYNDSNIFLDRKKNLYSNFLYRKVG